MKNERLPIQAPETTERYLVYAHLLEGGQNFGTNDLNSLPDQIRANAGRLVHISYCIIVDGFNIAQQMQERKLKPYFIDDNEKQK